MIISWTRSRLVRTNSTASFTATSISMTVGMSSTFTICSSRCSGVPRTVTTGAPSSLMVCSSLLSEIAR
jgi:hypothetical protein